MVWKEGRREGGVGVYLSISELNQSRFIGDNLIAFRRAILETLGQSKPLACHLVPVICVHELVIIHAVRCVALDSLDGRSAAVELEDIV